MRSLGLLHADGGAVVFRASLGVYCGVFLKPIRGIISTIFVFACLLVFTGIVSSSEVFPPFPIDSYSFSFSIAQLNGIVSRS